LLQKLILHQISNIPNCKSWRFVPKRYNFPDPNNPFIPPFPESLTYDNLRSDISDADFYACKTGDVNLSANNQLAPPVVMRSDPLELSIEASKLEAGSSVLIPVKASNFQDISAYQFTLEFDAGRLALEEVIPGQLAGLSKANFGLKRISEGILTTLWYNKAGSSSSLDKNQALFSLHFNVLDDSQPLPELIRLSSLLTEAVGFKTGGIPIGINLALTKGAQATGNLVSHAVVPNPITAGAILVFELGTDQRGRVIVIDQLGRTIQEQTGQFVAGKNEVLLEIDETWPQGVLFYKIQLPAGSVAGKIIHIKP
jgi:hypothetical protein